MERVAAQQAFDSAPDAACDAINLNGLRHVFRASGMKPAGGRQHWREPSLIETQKTDQEVLHLSISLSTSRSIASRGAVNTGLRGLKTMRHLESRQTNRIRTASPLPLLMPL